MLGSIVSVAAGASIGALLRWLLAGRLNPMHDSLPLGTLAANLLGGYLIGVAFAYFAERPDLPPEIRLFIVTGFLGGLTTFSTYSAEVVTLLHEARPVAALTVAAVHLLGSFALTALGIWTVHLLRQST